MHWGSRLIYDPKENNNEDTRYLVANPRESLDHQTATALQTLKKLSIIDQSGIKPIYIKFIKTITLAKTINSIADSTKYGSPFCTSQKATNLLKKPYRLPPELSLSIFTCRNIYHYYKRTAIQDEINQKHNDKKQTSRRRNPTCYKQFFIPD